MINVLVLAREDCNKDKRGDTVLSIVRNGPQTLVVQSDKIEEMTPHLKKIGGIRLTLEEAYNVADENSTVMLMTENKIKEASIEHFQAVMYFEVRCSQLLCKIMDQALSQFIKQMRLAPRIIVMRVLGNEEKMLREVEKDFEATSGNFFELLCKKNSGTVVWFTKQNLTKPISLGAICEEGLYIERDDKDLLREVTNHDLKYINKSINKKSWHEVTIKIYDAAGDYMLHYERVLHVVEELELGIVLGESWGKDSATVFLAVGVYRLRLFTFHEPKYIKKVLMALEFDEEGERLVDLDVFHHYMKMSWTDVKEKDAKSRLDMVKKYREVIMSNMNKRSQMKFLKYEKKAKS